MNSKKEYNVWRQCHLETDALGFWRITWPDGTYEYEKYSTRRKAENEANLKYYCKDDDE